MDGAPLWRSDKCRTEPGVGSRPETRWLGPVGFNDRVLCFEDDRAGGSGGPRCAALRERLGDRSRRGVRESSRVSERDLDLLDPLRSLVFLIEHAV